MSGIVPLVEADTEELYGAKAVGLGDAMRAGLPVPPGVGLSGPLVDSIASGEPESTAALLEAVRELPTPFAVRSSAVGEDSAGASFAGQHITVLNVPSAEAVEAAVREVWWSANSDSAITYRKRLGVFARPERRCGRAVTAPAGHGRRHVHAQPDHRRGRAHDRGELGAGRGGGLRSRHPRLLPGGPHG